MLIKLTSPNNETFFVDALDVKAIAKTSYVWEGKSRDGMKVFTFTKNEYPFVDDPIKVANAINTIKQLNERRRTSDGSTITVQGDRADLVDMIPAMMFGGIIFGGH